jgi:hypothetical protein
MSRPNNPVTQYGVQELGNLFLSVTGGYVFYVGTAAQLANMGDAAPGVSSRCYSTVNAALSQCASGRGDVIYVLPGYSESITADAWSNLAATDVSIIGMGRGTNRPTFTWTLAGSTMLFDTANFKLFNCQLYLAGAHAAGAALTVAAPITVSAAGCEISDCEIFWGFDADQIVGIGVTTTAAADFFNFNRNYCYAETAAAPTTTFMRLVGADYMQMYDTKIQGPTSSTSIGVVQFLTTASLGIDWVNVRCQNTVASSASAVVGLAGCTGTVQNGCWGILDNATKAGFTTPANLSFFNCYTVNDNGENGTAMTPVSA